MPHFRKTWIKTLDSLDFDALPDDFTRLTWMLLPLIACKEGRGLYHPAWLRSRLYPLRADVTQEMIQQSMIAIADLCMIETYSVAGRDYWQITKWHEYQNTSRDADSPYPEPENTNSGATQELLRSYSGVGNAIPARTSSISISNSNSISNSMKGGVGGNDDDGKNDDDGLITAVCSVCRGAGATGPATLDCVSWLNENKIAKGDVYDFGDWWKQYGRGKPWPKNLTSFWDDFINDRSPFFAQKKDNAQDSLEERKKRIAALIEAES